jgi:hypothetical protein
MTVTRPKRLRPAPCPFCGGKAVIEKSRLEGGWIVRCSHIYNGDPEECPVGPTTPPLVSAEAAVKAWNTRASRAWREWAAEWMASSRRQRLMPENHD